MVEGFAGRANELREPLRLDPGQAILAGTPIGRLLWLDAQGQTQRQIDLSEFNLVRDPEQFVTEYMKSPAGTPVRDPAPATTPTIDQRCGKVVKFSANLLVGQAGLAVLAKGPFTGRATFTVAAQANQTCVLSLLQKASGAGAIRVTVKEAEAPAPVCAVELPVSAVQEERLAAWRTTKTGQATLTLEYAAAAQAPGVELRQVAVFALTFPSRNVLRQGRTGTGDAGDTEPAELAPDKAELDLGVAPPKLAYFMPNDVELTAAARGAPPFKPVVWPDLPFDGQLAGKKDTSWKGAPVAGASSHATLTLTFAKPVSLTAFAVFEDSQDPARVTDTYAVFVHNATTKQWVKAGHVIGNRNPFNLFTFSPVSADQVVYLWLKSGDGHARLAEWEGYAAEDDLM